MDLRAYIIIHTMNRIMGSENENKKDAYRSLSTCLYVQYIVYIHIVEVIRICIRRCDTVYGPEILQTTCHFCLKLYETMGYPSTS